MAPIQYIKRSDIDDQKWNECIQQCPHGLIYATTLFLDHCSENWDALIIGDYEIIMPLPWKRKYGIRYLYQPAFCQQLGIFSRSYLDESLIGSFLQTLRDRFCFSEINLNYSNRFNGGVLRSNFILPLSRPYDIICRNYSVKLRQHLRKAEKSNLQLVQSEDISEVVFEYDRSLPKMRGTYSKSFYQNFLSLSTALYNEGSLVLRNMENSGGEILARVLMVNDGRRLYNLMTVTTPEGRSLRANHFLIDGVIREFATRVTILDFEGSEIPGVRVFYESFGTTNQPYYLHRHNQLPFPYKLFKK